MGGNAYLLKKFARTEVFEIAPSESDPFKFAKAGAMLEPAPGGINREAIKAPGIFLNHGKAVNG
jgi:malic enzyme